MNDNLNEMKASPVLYHVKLLYIEMEQGRDLLSLPQGHFLGALEIHEYEQKEKGFVEERDEVSELVGGTMSNTVVVNADATDRCEVQKGILAKRQGTDWLRRMER